MTERLLHFIWQFQYFNTLGLTTVTEEPVQVIFPGHYNDNQGPDFTSAKIKVGNTLWVGAVELHCRTSDWNRHRHQTDSNYNNVILHVVWEHDHAGNDLPVLELKNKVSKLLLQRYDDLMRGAAFIPCEKNILQVPGIIWKSWKDRLLAERLIRKASQIEEWLRQSNYHWEETFWWLLARNFGMKVNADLFEAIARSLPLSMLAKQRQQLVQLEALLFGQAGLLEETFLGDYPRHLEKEYRFCQKKYKLYPVPIAAHFLRMRPGNFPTIRLAQLAALLQNSSHLFSTIRENNSLKAVRDSFQVMAGEYWNEHYRFDECSSFKKKQVGNLMADHLIINAVVPMLFAYGMYHHDQVYKDKALAWLEETAGENNNVMRRFNAIGIESQNAFDSQALLELKTQYCDRKNCLSCGIGNYILKWNG